MADHAEYELACAEALLAGTLALMTGHVQSSCAEHRLHIRRKILAHLSQLTRHECISPQFRLMLGNLQAHWQRWDDPDESPPPAATEGSPWHSPVDRVQ